MRYILFWTCVFCGCASCSTPRRTSAGSSSPSAAEPSATLHTSALSRSEGSTGRDRVDGIPLTMPGYNYVNVKGLDIEELDALHFKYAMALDVPVELIINLPLYHFIDDWMGAPYHLGGNTRDGIDCSGFTKILEETVFNLNLPRTSGEQYKECHKVPVPELQEGDLVFFGTRKKGISHVGVYLTNNKFVHASTSFGVMISDLGDGYWSRRFRGAGRMPL